MHSVHRRPAGGGETQHANLDQSSRRPPQTDIAQRIDQRSCPCTIGKSRKYRVQVVRFWSPETERVDRTIGFQQDRA